MWCWVGCCGVAARAALLVWDGGGSRTIVEDVNCAVGQRLCPGFLIFREDLNAASLDSLLTGLFFEWTLIQAQLVQCNNLGTRFTSWAAFRVGLPERAWQSRNIWGITCFGLDEEDCTDTPLQNPISITTIPRYSEFTSNSRAKTDRRSKEVCSSPTRIRTDQTKAHFFLLHDNNNPIPCHTVHNTE